MRFECIPPAQKFDELFVGDKQDYEYDKVKIVKMRQDELAALDKAAKKHVPAKAIQEASDGQGNETPGRDAKLVKERSVEELSDDEEDQGGQKKGEGKYVDTRNEKPMEVFKNLYSDFKEFIPGKKSEDQPEGRKQTFMNKARGFFGL